MHSGLYASIISGQCDCINLQRHPGLWELQRHPDDISYHEGLGKNNLQMTEVGDEHRRRAVRFHAWQSVYIDIGKAYDRVLCPYLFDMIMDVMGRVIKEQRPGVCCLHTISCCAVLRKLEEWRKIMEER